MLYIRASELILLTLYPLTYISLFPPPSKLCFVFDELVLLEFDSLHSLKMYFLFLLKSVAVPQLYIIYIPVETSESACVYVTYLDVAVGLKLRPSLHERFYIGVRNDAFELN